MLKRGVALRGAFELNVSHPNYDVARDGQHFAMIRRVGEDPQIIVVHNWIRELRARTGTGAK